MNIEQSGRDPFASTANAANIATNSIINGFIENSKQGRQSHTSTGLEMNGVQLNEFVAEPSLETSFPNSLRSQDAIDKTDANGFFVNHNHKLQDALVKAVKQGNVQAVVLLLEHYMQLHSDGSRGFDNSTVELNRKSINFPPLIVSAQHGNFDMINLFLSKGFKLEREHDVTCKCEDCLADVFVTSQRRIEVYRAIANPMWISITSNDPFLTAFKLSESLKSLARKEDEYVKEYDHLSIQCSQFAMALLDECRTSKEQRIVLSYPGDEAGEDDYMEDSLGLVNSAISYGQKEFVAHPITQHLLMNFVFADVTGWRTGGLFYKIGYVTYQAIIFPFMALMYFFCPCFPVARKVKRPFIKFINHTASFVIFLILLAASSEAKLHIRFRHWPSAIEWITLAWVLGLAWNEIKQVRGEGTKRYFTSGWNWMDISMVVLLLGAFLIWITLIIITALTDISQYFYSMILSAGDGMYAMGMVASFFRLVYLCQVSRYLGLLQLSLSRMVRVIFQFAFISCVVLWSFSVGMTMLYTSSFEAYNKTHPIMYNTTDPIAKLLVKDYHSLTTTMVTLMWASLDMVGLDSLQIFKEQSLIQVWTAFLFTLYHASSMIVLLNMLIAMMSNSYQQVEDNIETEYKFARAQLWVDYIGDGQPTLPPPLNLIPPPKYVFRCVCRLTNRCFGLPRKVPCVGQRNFHVYDERSMGRDHKMHEYRCVVKDLVSRYWAKRRRFLPREETADNTEAMQALKEEVTDMLSEIRNIIKATGRARRRANQKRKQVTRMPQVLEGIENTACTETSELESASTNMGNNEIVTEQNHNEISLGVRETNETPQFTHSRL